MNRDTVIGILTSIDPNLGDDTNLLAQGIIDSNQFVDLIAQLEDLSGQEIDFLTVNPETILSIDGLMKTFNSL